MRGSHVEVKTHRLASLRLVGEPISVRDDVEAVVELEAREEMAVDGHGLIHGGFAFGLADYAAMLAVNHPYVVLGASETRFLAPIKVGDRMRAHAAVAERHGRRREVDVEVSVGADKVLEGRMTCFVLDRHVLER